MRPLDRIEPRWVVLLLVPALLAAGAAQPSDVGSPGTGAVLTQREPAVARAAGLEVGPAVALLPVAGPVTLADAGAAPWVKHASRAGGRPAVGRPSAQERGRAALRALAYDPTSLGYRVRFLPYRGGVLGSTHRHSRLITVYVPRGQSELALRTTIAHELGHALDFARGTPERRASYREVRRLPAGPWFPCDRCSDFASPAGDFAEVFAAWLAGPGDFRGRLADPPSAAQLRELEPLFAVPRPTPQASRLPGPSPTPSPSPSPSPRSALPVLLERPPSPAPGGR